MVDKTQKIDDNCKRVVGDDYVWTAVKAVTTCQGFVNRCIGS